MDNEHTNCARGVCRAVAVSALAAVLLTTGCSFSASSKSSSDIISSPFKSSSKSSGGGNDQAYQEQTAGYSQAFVEVDGDEELEVFQRGLSDIAARLGISDWEKHTQTWTSVGRGLGQARLSGGEMVTYASSWSGGDRAIMALVLEGYAETR